MSTHATEASRVTRFFQSYAHRFIAGTDKRHAGPKKRSGRTVVARVPDATMQMHKNEGGPFAFFASRQVLPWVTRWLGLTNLPFDHICTFIQQQGFPVRVIYPNNVVSETMHRSRTGVHNMKLVSASCADALEHKLVSLNSEDWATTPRFVRC